MSEMKKNAPSLTYRDAGVDIDAGNEAVQRMKAHVRSTYRPEVLGDIGGFGGLFALNTENIGSLYWFRAQTALALSCAWHF